MTADIVINQSRLATWDDCKRKAYWTFEQNLVPLKPTHYFETGRAVHHYQALVANGASPDEALIEAKKTYYKDVKHALAMPGEAEKITANVEMLDTLLPAFAAQSKPSYTPLATEVYGKWHMGGGRGRETGTQYRVFLKYRIDTLVNDRGFVWVLDYKTAKKLDLRDINKYSFSPQMILYVGAARHALQTNVPGAIVEVMVKTQIPQFVTVRFEYTEEQVLEEVAEAIEKAIDWAEKRPNGKDVFTKNRGSCVGFGECPYMSLCEKDNETRRMAYKPRQPDYVDEENQSTSEHADRPAGS